MFIIFQQAIVQQLYANVARVNNKLKKKDTAYSIIVSILTFLSNISTGSKTSRDFLLSCKTLGNMWVFLLSSKTHKCLSTTPKVLAVYKMWGKDLKTVCDRLLRHISTKLFHLKAILWLIPAWYHIFNVLITIFMFCIFWISFYLSIQR